MPSHSITGTHELVEFMKMIPTDYAAGDRLPRPVRGSGREAVVVLALHGPGCKPCTDYAGRLEGCPGIDEWDGNVIHVDDVDPHAPRVIIADQWGEIAVVHSAGQTHQFMEPDEVVAWLRYLAMKCPECEGEAL